MSKGILFGIFCSFILNSTTIYGSSTNLFKKRSANRSEWTRKKTGTFDVKIAPHQKDALFDQSHPVTYDVSIFNHYSQTQEGKISIEVKYPSGGIVGVIETDFKIRSGQKKKIVYEIPVKEPGIYDLYFKINLTDYDDTIRNVFGYRALEINTPVHMPEDFDSFWQKTISDLSLVHPEYSVKFDPSLSTISHNVYRVEMQSLGGVTVYGWLTSPKVGGYYPVLVGFPGYRVTLKPLYADDFVIFQFNIRSTKAEGDIILEKEYDYTLYDIDNKDKYIYRGAYMDCIRAIDFIYSRSDDGLNIDTSRIAVTGGSQGGALALVTAALDHRVKACITDNPIYCDINNLVEISGRKNPVEWPVNKYKDYLQHSPGLTMKNILRTMDYFDPQNFTPLIKCPVLLGLGLLDIMAPPSTIFAAYNKLSKATKQKSETYSFHLLAHEVTMRHRNFQSQWLLEKLAYSKK